MTEQQQGQRTRHTARSRRVAWNLGDVVSSGIADVCVRSEFALIVLPSYSSSSGSCFICSGPAPVKQPGGVAAPAAGRTVTVNGARTEARLHPARAELKGQVSARATGRGAVEDEVQRETFYERIER
jgi:hypothetical protein